MFKYMLAPLEDYTGPALRELCFQNGADLTFTEMTRVEGIVRGNKATLSRFLFAFNTPTKIQLLASNEIQLENYLKDFETFKGFCGFDLNLCCPSKNIISYGRGAAMIKRTEKANKLIKIIKKFDYPVSVKIRLGLNQFEKENKIYLKAINEIDADFFTIHCKTASQKSYEAPDYSMLPECTDTGKNIIANGNIDTIKKVKKMKSLGCKGVMIGRSAIKNPVIFNELKGKEISSKKYNPVISKKEIKKQFLELHKKSEEKEKYLTNFLSPEF